MDLDSLSYRAPDLEPSTEICRYMSFAKFFDLLLTEELYIPFADAFPDKFEGIPHDENDFVNAQKLDALIRLSGRQEQKKKKEVERRQDANDLAQLRQALIGVSCWTRFDRESNLMWSSYSNATDGVALVVSIESLIDSIEKPPFPLFLGMTAYGKQAKAKNLPSHLESFFSKRIVFSEEREIRLIADLSEMKDNRLVHREVWKNAQQSGLTLKLDFKRAARRIIVAPQMPHRIFELVDTQCKAAGIAFDINQSWLSEQPRISKRK